MPHRRDCFYLSVAAPRDASTLGMTSVLLTPATFLLCVSLFVHGCGQTMRVERISDAAFAAEFEDGQELREEHRLNLSQWALRLATAEKVPLYAKLQITLRGPFGGVGPAGPERSDRHRRRMSNRARPRGDSPPAPRGRSVFGCQAVRARSASYRST